MKNNIFKFIIVLFCFFYNNLLAEDFTIESSEINILKKGNIIHAKNGVNIFSNDGIEITTDEVIYDKKKIVAYNIYWYWQSPYTLLSSFSGGIKLLSRIKKNSQDWSLKDARLIQP